MNYSYVISRAPKAIMLWCVLLSGCVLFRPHSTKSQALCGDGGCLLDDSGSSGCSVVDDSAADTGEDDTSSNRVEAE